MRTRRCLFTILAMILLALPAPARGQDIDIPATYGEPAGRLIRAAMGDTAAWLRLAELTDRFGHRFSGSQSLERAIDWILEEMRTDGLENVRGEPVMVPHWVRGEESATLVAPREVDLPMLGLGGSIATPAAGIEAEVLIVDSFDELRARASEARGRIVLYNVPFTNYGETVQYRSTGAIEAARAGAVASLVRSVGPYGMKTPHTGGMRYEDGVRQIPHAAITMEDAMMLQRMADRGDRVVVRLNMSARMLPDAESRNVVAELRGREFPDQYVVMGGHIDSWDVGTGAMDDAGGCVAAWEALRLMKELGLRPRRTIRVVCWTNEENGLRGANAYVDAHRDEVDRHVFALESDNGVFTPSGFGFTGSDAAFAIVERIGRLLEPIGVGNMTRGGGGADIGPLNQLGVPVGSPTVDGSRYFWYHHTNADTVDKLDAHDIALVTAGMAVLTYVIADLPQSLPRDVSDRTP